MKRHVNIVPSNAVRHKVGTSAPSMRAKYPSSRKQLFGESNQKKKSAKKPLFF